MERVPRQGGIWAVELAQKELGELPPHVQLHLQLPAETITLASWLKWHGERVEYYDSAWGWIFSVSLDPWRDASPETVIHISMAYSTLPTWIRHVPGPRLVSRKVRTVVGEAKRLAPDHVCEIVEQRRAENRYATIDLADVRRRGFPVASVERRFLWRQWDST